MKHQFPTPHPAKKRRTQSLIPEDAWSIIASFLPMKEQFSVLYTSKCIQQTVLNSILQDTKNSTIIFEESVHHGYNAVSDTKGIVDRSFLKINSLMHSNV
jgi:hypothetical protein